MGKKSISILIQLEPCNDMFEVTSGIMAIWYELIKTFLITINFCNAKKMNCVLMFIIHNHYGRKYLSMLIQLVPCIESYFGHNSTMV